MDHVSDETLRDIETKYVKSTYDNIAEDFSRTRYKKWPKVDAYLRELPKYSLCLDVGCGNGKYLDNDNTVNIGCDISFKLLSICKNRGFEVVNCDIIQQPFKKGLFDSIICIAVLHHIVTSQRRKQCIDIMLDLLTIGGTAFIQVWSFEQHQGSNKYLKTNKLPQRDQCQSDSKRQVSIDETIKLPIHQNRTPFTDQEMLVPFTSSGSTKSNVEPNLRYYHLFKEGELENMIRDNEKANLLDSFYDQGNWCVIVSKKA